MRLGVVLPNLGPGASADRIFAVAETAEAVGLDALWASDHLAYPVSPSVPYPYIRGARRFMEPTPTFDPMAVLSAVAGRTERIALCFGILILPLRHPLVTAKSLATLDQLSGGRVVLGVGAGWMPEEFAAVDSSLSNRFGMLEEQIHYLRAVWSQDLPEFSGAYYRISGLNIEPKPVKRSIPIWMGGNSRAATRRAVALADGSHFLDLALDELHERAILVQQSLAAAGRTREGFALSCQSSLRLTSAAATPNERQMPITGDIGQVTEDVLLLRSWGFDHVAFSPRPRNLELAGLLRFVETLGKQIRPATQ